MAGLDINGFLPDTIYNIKSRIEEKLEQLNPGFDFSPESPDGQLIGIMSAEIAVLWEELAKVYRSYDPNHATGQALRNIGQLTGIPYQTATRSSATVLLEGTAGTIVQAGSYVSNSSALFYTAEDVTLPSSVVVIADTVGPVPVDTSDPIINIDSVVHGWDTVSQADDGEQGGLPINETKYRNLRNRTVMRNSVGSVENIKARLIELGMEQAIVINNDTAMALTDGTPPRSIHVVVGEHTSVTDEQISDVISEQKGLGVPTFGSTSVTKTDSIGIDHVIKFTKSVVKPIYINLNVTFLDEERSGAENKIKEALAGKINSLLVGEDVVWSRLFEYVTPYAKAQINSLEISDDNITFVSTNLAIASQEYTSCSTGDISITVT